MSYLNQEKHNFQHFMLATNDKINHYSSLPIPQALFEIMVTNDVFGDEYHYVLFHAQNATKTSDDA